MEDHLNPTGLLCAGSRACAYCRRCDSCAVTIPGTPHADVCGKPQECTDWICPKCTSWLREIDGEKKVKAAVEGNKKRTRKGAVRSGA